MRLIDTHCHIQFDAYDLDRDEVIRKCGEREIGLMIVGCDEKSSRDAVALAERIEHDAWCSVGQHPTDSGEPFDYKIFLELAQSSKKVLAVGECGLDYYHVSKDENERREEIEKQKDLFFQHLNLAHELNLPLIIHCRDAHDDMIEMLVHRFGVQPEKATGSPIKSGMTENARDDKLKGVMHCFTGTVAQAQSYLDLGFLISFTGIITFAHQYDEVVRAVPLEKILIETD